VKKAFKSISFFLVTSLFLSVAIADKPFNTVVNAAVSSGWKLINKNWYYYNSSGVPVKGWMSISSKWYYFDSNGVMQTGWKLISGKWYYFDPSGVMKTGWLQLNGKWYYLDSSGVMKTGWLALNGNWYCMDASGVMKTDWVQVGTKWYYFYSSGIMAKNTLINGYSLSVGGAWDTSLPIEKGAGNTSGNLDNDGLVVQNGSWYYYVDSYGGGIYKKDDSEKVPVKLSDDGDHLSILGNWLYYTVYGSLYKMNLDGTNKIQLSKDYVTMAITKSDYIYYSGSSGKEKGLFRMNHDGTGKVKLISGDVSKFAVEDGYIYYSNDNGTTTSYTGIYKAKIDGSQNTKLSDDVVSGALCMDNGYLYFTKKNDITNFNDIYKMKADGTGKVRFNNESVFNINVRDGWIYYNCEEESEPGLHRMSVDGTEDQFLMYGGYLAPNIVGNWVYVIDRGGSAYTLTRINLDGSIIEYFQE
jgi:hypothetical protein